LILHTSTAQLKGAMSGEWCADMVEITRWPQFDTILAVS